MCLPSNARWMFRIFVIFFCSGEGKGEPPRRREGGGRFFYENPRGGVVSRVGGWGGGRGAGRVCRELGGGGLNIFFFGAERPTKQMASEERRCHLLVPSTYLPILVAPCLAVVETLQREWHLLVPFHCLPFCLLLLQFAVAPGMLLFSHGKLRTHRIGANPENQI